MSTTANARIGCMLAAVVLPAWLLRIVLLSRVEGGNAVPLDDAAGFIADLGVGAMAFGLVLATLRGPRVIAMLLVFAWTLVQGVSYESVRALDALPSFGDAGYLTSPTFVLGSGVQLFTSGWPLAAMAVALTLAWFGSRARPTPQQIAGGFVLGALLLGVQSSIGWSPEVADWRQTHVLLHNSPDLGIATAPDPMDVVAEPPTASIASDLAVDLSGLRDIPVPSGTPNVLLILVESVSGAYVPALAAVHGHEARPRMPRLDAFASAHRSYSTFVTHQINTNRGLYSALCGDLPKLLPGTPKMSIHAATGLTTCLPGLLREAGYRTAYLQAAPLGFMLKDQFLPKIGFDEVLGDASFSDALGPNAVRSEWGVDDGTLFAAGRALVARLRGGDGPWFATLLTVGTHHPYLVPPHFARESEREFQKEVEGEPESDDEFGRAMAFADQQLGRLLEDLDRMGVFKDTLVLVSSDESRGWRAQGDAVSQLISQNWGVLVAAGPGISRARIDVPFGLLDIPASVLDYLSRGEDAYRAGLLGRSVFRRYDEPRHVFFANTRRDAAGAIDPSGRLLLCRHEFTHCGAFAVPDGVFAASRRPLDWDAPDGGVVAAVARWSVIRGAAQGQPESIELMAEPQVTLPDANPRLLHGGQNVELAAGDWLEVELDVTVGRRSGVELRHTLKDSREVRLDATRPLRPGSRLRLLYTFVPDEGFGKTQALTIARALRSGPGTLDFQTARMYIRRGGAPARGVTLLTDEVIPAARAGAGQAPTNP